MKSRIFCSAVLLGLFGANNFASAEEPDIGLVSITPHPAIEHTHACKIVKTDAADTADCDDPKCASGGTDVDKALASRGVKRICKTIDKTVNRGFDVTYSVYGKKHVAWTEHDPEAELNQIGLTSFEEHSPLNPVCASMTFQEASGIKECGMMKE